MINKRNEYIFNISKKEFLEVIEKNRKEYESITHEQFRELNNFKNIVLKFNFEGVLKITREKFQQIANHVMLKLPHDKNEFLKICTLAKIDMDIFNKRIDNE